MNNDLIPALIACFSGIVIIMALIVDAYFKFKKSTTIALKVAKQSPQWKKVKQVLEQDFTYYQQLPVQYQEEFIHRTFVFMRLRRWVSSSQQQVDLAKKVLVSASAIQLTFGLKNFNFRRFNTILIHDDAYYSRITGQYHRGEVNQQGIIVLSWKHFEEGYKIENDKINLGLHEMAHALDLAINLSDGRMYQLQRLMKKFEQSAFDEIVKMRSGQTSFLRAYGATNAKEFFSVAVEHFFEAPAEFQEKLPDLYIELCQLLNQDMYNRVYRGYKSPNSGRYDNNIKETYFRHIKPKFVLKPNLSLAIPFAAISAFSALSFPVINAFVIHWTGTSIVIAVGLYLGLIYFTYYFKAKQITLFDNHLYSNNFILNNDTFTAHLKNIINVSFTNMLTHYQTSVSYFDGDNIRERQLSIFASPAGIKKLERHLLQQNIRIKHNNKWLKRENT